MPELSNYAVCYEAIQRVYRNAVISAARRALKEAYGPDWLNRIKKVFEKEWQEVVDAAREIREAGSLDASLVDDFDCLGVNHFHNLFGAFFNDLFPRAAGVSDNVRNEERRAVLRFATEVNDYRNAMSHPAEKDLPARDARRLLDSALWLLRKIDSAAATQILDYEGQLVSAETPPPGPPPKDDHTAREIAYHRFFIKVLNLVTARSNEFDTTHVGYGNWISFSAGRPWFNIRPVLAKGDRLRVELYISTDTAAKNRMAFEQLDAQKSEIEAALDEPLVFERMPSDCRIFVRYNVPIDPANPPEDALEWAAQRVVKFREVFGPRIRGLGLDSATEASP